MTAKHLIVSVFFFVIISVVAASKIRYDGYKVFRITPKTREHLNFIENLKKLKDVVFWEGPSDKIGVESDVMVPPNISGDLQQAAAASGLYHSEFISDVQTLIESEPVIERGSKLNWHQYARLDAIYDFLEDQAALHPKTVKLITIGHSFEGRELKVIKISKGESSNPGIWIDSNMHAREWVSGAVVTCLINNLLNGENETIKSWINDFDFYILPVANPDGYEYTHTTDRIWRKTRSSNSSSICKGADPNRNFGYKWMTKGSSLNPCDETYAGWAPFSEPETRAISNFYTNISSTSKIVGFFTVHSYSQLILLPFGAFGEAMIKSEHYDYMEVAKEVQKAMGQRYNTKFKSGSITDILYPASGGSLDWVKALHNPLLAYAFELRDTGKYGFLLPPDQILPSCLEFMDGFQIIVDALRKKVKDTTKPILRKTPMVFANFERQTFGDSPRGMNKPIISGFRRH